MKIYTYPDAIRGREQQLIELNGGAKSQGGSSGNAINGISPTNPKRQSYPHSQEVVFDYRSSEPLKDLSVLLSAKQLFRIAVYRRVIGSGYWKKVGKLPLREDLLPVQMEYIYHKFDSIQFEIYNPATGKVTPATKDECRGLEEAAVWDYGAIIDRIRDYYNGVPCIWLNEEHELFKD